ncbi:MAG TPA: putative toxin-antitoxin system toxin component, PIN family [Elusimicrobia bacterium]|nr:putative toxin-antitoxin system toxin component, PIN family [Elusimicrobiota bacterium]
MTEGNPRGMKIVIDANVVIAAFATRGLCNEIFEICLIQHEIFLCDALIREVKTGLLKKIKVPENVVENIVKFLESKTLKVKPSEVDKRICRDSKDIMVLGTAESVGADVILTGDKDLLVLKTYKNTKIVTPRQFLELLKQNRS